MERYALILSDPTLDAFVKREFDRILDCYDTTYREYEKEEAVIAAKVEALLDELTRLYDELHRQSLQPKTPPWVPAVPDGPVTV